MPLHRDEGVVLRTRNLGEADRIITFLTRERGRVRAVGITSACAESTIPRS
jgi:DNA repair protein RecO (recombination protein O)